MTGGSVSATVDTPAVVEVAGRERVRVLAGTVATVGAPLLVVAGLALANGGSEPTQWGWASLLLLWVGATGILLTRLEFGWLDLMFLGGLLALLGWVAASLLWTNDDGWARSSASSCTRRRRSPRSGSAPGGGCRRSRPASGRAA